MRCHHTVLILLTICLLCPPVQAAEGKNTSKTFAQHVQPFLRKHCIKCHGPEKKKSGLRLDTLSTDFSKHNVAEMWTEVRDRLNGGTMPPKKEPKPDLVSLTRVTEWIAQEVRQAAAARQSTGGRVVLRRMNRAEYNNTIRDLVGIDFQPAADFPEDPPAHGFDNIGAALRVSPTLLEKYLKAARTIVNRSIVTGERPPRHEWHLEVEQAHASNQFPGRRSAGRSELWLKDPVSKRHRYILKGGGVEVRGNFLVQRGSRGEGAAGFRWFKIPAKGKYLIRIRAAGVIPSRKQVVEGVKQARLARLKQSKRYKKANPTDQKKMRQRFLEREWPNLAKHFRTDSMYDFGAPRMKVTTDEGVVIGEVSVDAPPENPKVYTFSCEFEPRKRGTDGINITNNYQVPRVLENFWFQHDKEFPRPELLIDWVKFEGVHVDDWPPASHQRILFASSNRGQESTYAREVLERFMTRAYRRPVTSAEVEGALGLFKKVRPHKTSFEEAIKVPLIAILTSPHFLYLVEPNADTKARDLNHYEIASRLSYFLWSSMPDEELFRLAADKNLRDPATLRAQVDRMLKDPRSGAFVTNFAGQWLGLRKVGANPPVANLFPRYDDHLAQSMVGESEAFFAEILHRDRSVRNFMQSDFVTINQRLARFYGIPGVKGAHFRRVAVPKNVRRGGLLTQASILTITSNGTRTSPVVRGVWILENLLGDPPPPPPPDAGDLAPKVPGINKASVRVRLEAHRRIPQCASCHRKIDPLGFALENFDAHGRWRDQYGFGYNRRVNPDDPKVDASGQLPDGTRFDGIRGLQKVLLDREEQFLVCLTEKLMTYALGRGVEYADRPRRDRFVANLKKNGYALRGLIKDLVTSDLFLKN